MSAVIGAQSYRNGREPAPLTHGLLLEEARRLLRDLQHYQVGALQEAAQSGRCGEIGALQAQLEQVCIHQRVVRVLVWLRLLIDDARETRELSGRRLLADILCDAALLNETSTLLGLHLSRELNDLSMRSRNLLTRVARLNEFCKHRGDKRDQKSDLSLKVNPLQRS